MPTFFKKLILNSIWHIGPISNKLVWFWCGSVCFCWWHHLQLPSHNATTQLANQLIHLFAVVLQTQWWMKIMPKVCSYLPKFFGTAARTYLVNCIHRVGLVHLQKRSLANQLANLLLCVRSSHWPWALSAEDLWQGLYTPWGTSQWAVHENFCLFCF